MMRARSPWRIALLAAALCLPPDGRRADAQSKPKAAVSVARRDSLKRLADREALAVAHLAAETRATARRLAASRREYLARASWADLGDRCNPGALRVFANDTSPAQRQAMQSLVDQMERTIVLRGAGRPLSAADSRALLRVIVGWEAGIDRPRWDEDGAAVHRAVATGLTGEVPDPASSGCLPSPVVGDTVTFVVPGFTDMVFPKAPRPRVKAYFGPEGQQRARDEFFTAVGSKSPDAELAYIVIAPMVIWQDYAVVGVTRPRERGGYAIDPENSGGAAYLLRRVGTEWRLLSIVRSWGS